MRITDKDFQIKQVIALEPTGTTRGGVNKPLFITAFNQHLNKTEEFVLKYRGAERMNEWTSARELIAVFLAMQVGIPVPEPAIVSVNDLFINLLTQHSDYAQIMHCKGINFGSQMLEAIDLIRNQSLPPLLLKQAMRIFIFDIMIQNADRNFQKPNMLLSNNHIYVIDHETAFGFIDTVPWLCSENPWTFNETDVQSFKNHFFYQHLRHSPLIDVDEALEPFGQINDIFWEKLSNFVPQEWRTAEIQNIQQHITQILEHLSEFKKEIWTKLLVQ